MKTNWEEIKSAIKLRVPSHSFRMWIEPLRFSKCDDDCVFLSSPNFFSKKRVLDQYGDIIESELRKATGKSCRFIVKVPESKDRSSKELDENPQLPLPQMNVYPQNGRFLRKDFTFDQFVVGGNNDFAYSAALSLASRKNSLQNCLFLLSKTGMGKSHLSQAVGHYILSEHPRDRVYYTTAENFSNEMVNAYRNNSIDVFKGKYRNQCDVLLLDALTLDTLFESSKKIIFSSCYLPSDIPKLNDELRSRLSCALISNIEPPEFRTRVRILQKKAKRNGCKIPEDIIHYLASELTEDVRQLESGLVGVTAKSSLLGTSIDLGLAESVVKNIVCRRKNITVDVIKKLVCKHYRISVKEIVSSSRKQSIVRPRQIAIYLSRRYTDAPLQAIGKSFNRYHATALYSIGAVDRELKEKGAIQKQVEFLCQKLETGKF